MPPTGRGRSLQPHHTTHANGRPAIEWKVAQNVCLFPFQYGSCLDKGLPRQDALYALSKLFQFAASSQLQFLNLLHNCIKHELSFVGQQNVGRRNAVSLLNLKYTKTQLTLHSQGLAETDITLENRDSLGWPRAPEPPKADKAANLLLTDFKYLLQRAETLARECELGTDHAGEQLRLGRVEAFHNDGAETHGNSYHIYSLIIRLLDLGHELPGVGFGLLALLGMVCDGGTTILAHISF
ncbi:hypothetical protein MMC31_008226 [Peltigera leucophlebia]|nr:hypothetical protein [Peltigera leucophlebia]